MEVDKQHALESARIRYGGSLRILAATDVAGYGATAVAHHGIGWVTGVSLAPSVSSGCGQSGNRTCLKVGGINP
jgi:hypothetical protein